MFHDQEPELGRAEVFDDVIENGLEATGVDHEVLKGRCVHRAIDRLEHFDLPGRGFPLWIDSELLAVFGVQTSVNILEYDLEGASVHGAPENLVG
ncbi:MAG: hypothetical protein Q7R22_014285 [Verrucomicrobiota bacterium JB025]|nr:hypothetical protein [Verrucomicrobiota bacterium JB025]